MNGLALAVLVLTSGGARSHLALPDWAGAQALQVQDVLGDALSESALRAAGVEEPWSPPACIGDTCQPRVSVPGFEPRIDTRGKRTELFVSALERMDAGILATVARSMAVAGVRLEYKPPQLQQAVPGRPGAGRVELLVRWRLDAWHDPVWRTPLAR
jgi:hypothetical protein